MTSCKSVLLALAVALATSPAAQAQSDCDTAGGWYGNSTLGACYSVGLLKDLESPSGDWFQADQYCQDLRDGRARLATVREESFTHPRDFSICERNKFSFKRVMEHVIRIPRMYVTFFS